MEKTNILFLSAVEDLLWSVNNRNIFENYNDITSLEWSSQISRVLRKKKNKTTTTIKENYKLILQTNNVQYKRPQQDF